MFAKSAVVLFGLTLLLSVNAQAHRPSTCWGPIKMDSYGRGIEAGFRQQNLKPRKINEECYEMGIQRGTSLRTEPQEFGCADDFERGYRDGFETTLHSAGSPCRSAGYLAGESALHVGAREQNVNWVGYRCVESYRDGLGDSRARKSRSIPLSQPEASCYRTGYADGELFR